MTKSMHILLLLVLILLFDFGGNLGMRQTLPTKEQIVELRDKNQRLEEQLNNIMSETKIYESAMKDEQALRQLVEEEEGNFRLFAGFVPLKGEGVVILMSDSQRIKGEYQSISELIIHDEDVYQMIWELRNAGAEAISINDERVLFHYSKVTCNGPTIRVNGRLFSQPFIIKAIGPRKALQAAINVYGSHAHSLRQKGVFIEANTSVMVEIPSYRDEPVFRYIERSE